MIRASRLSVAVGMGLVVVALLACKKKEESTGSSASASGADAVGVPECDEYLTKYEKCIKDKVPAAARPQLETSMKQTRDSWKSLAANPTTKAGLAQGCKQALDTAKTAMGAYGCAW
jgi:hypothetical protein